MSSKIKCYWNVLANEKQNCRKVHCNRLVKYLIIQITCKKKDVWIFWRRMLLEKEYKANKYIPGVLSTSCKQRLVCNTPASKKKKRTGFTWQKGTIFLHASKRSLLTLFIYKNIIYHKGLASTMPNTYKKMKTSHKRAWW